MNCAQRLGSRAPVRRIHHPRGNRGPLQANRNARFLLRLRCFGAGLAFGKADGPNVDSWEADVDCDGCAAISAIVYGNDRESQRRVFRANCCPSCPSVLRPNRKGGLSGKRRICAVNMPASPSTTTRPAPNEKASPWAGRAGTERGSIAAATGSPLAIRASISLRTWNVAASRAVSSSASRMVDPVGPSRDCPVKVLTLRTRSSRLRPRKIG